MLPAKESAEVTEEGDDDGFVPHGEGGVRAPEGWEGEDSSVRGAGEGGGAKGVQGGL